MTKQESEILVPSEDPEKKEDKDKKLNGKKDVETNGKATNGKVKDKQEEDELVGGITIAPFHTHILV